jgi:hypothetical protein
MPRNTAKFNNTIMKNKTLKIICVPLSPSPLFFTKTMRHLHMSKMSGHSKKPTNDQMSSFVACL